MKFFVFGSLNIDKVYSLENLPATGENVTALHFEEHIGGKGLNQAISLKRAGAQVHLAGAVGFDGAMLTDYLKENGIDISFVDSLPCPTGHCVIQIDRNGKNQMLLFTGANRLIKESFCDKVVSTLDEGDLILMQYETSCTEYMAKKCSEKGVKIAFNPSPLSEGLINFPYEAVDYLILNEDEGRALTGETDPEKITLDLIEKRKVGSVVLTLGSDGSCYRDKSGYFTIPCVKANAVDTTGAGDTFTGYFLKILFETNDPALAMRTAAKASAVCVSKIGAAQTIPYRCELE